MVLEEGEGLTGSHQVVEETSRAGEGEEDLRPSGWRRRRINTTLSRDIYFCRLFF